jgi:hypothetical protein
VFWIKKAGGIAENPSISQMVGCFLLLPRTSVARQAVFLWRPDDKAGELVLLKEPLFLHHGRVLKQTDEGFPVILLCGAYRVEEAAAQQVLFVAKRPGNR